MTAVRTEELGLAGLLPLTMGGVRIDLPVLSIEQSERWLRYVGGSVETTRLPDTIGDMLTLLGPKLFDAVLAYQTLGACPEDCPRRGVEPGFLMNHEHVGALGEPATIRKRMTKAELRGAIEAMVLAENPFATDLRSVVEAFGPQIRAMIPLLVATVADRLVQANWRPTLSGSGGSTPPPSDGDSRANSSSSSGSTTSDDGSTAPGTSET